jgi:hypothetical protein
MVEDADEGGPMAPDFRERTVGAPPGMPHVDEKRRDRFRTLHSALCTTVMRGGRGAGRLPAREADKRLKRCSCVTPVGWASYRAKVIRVS